MPTAFPQCSILVADMCAVHHMLETRSPYQKQFVGLWASVARKNVKATLIGGGGVNARRVAHMCSPGLESAKKPGAPRSAHLCKRVSLVESQRIILLVVLLAWASPCAEGPCRLLT